MDLAAPDLDHAADRDRLITAEVQDALQDQVGVEARGTEGRRITGFEGQGQEDARIERPMMVGVAREHEAMGQRFAFIRVQFGHARRVRRFEVGLLRTCSSDFRESLARAHSGRNLLRERNEGILVERNHVVGAGWGKFRALFPRSGPVPEGEKGEGRNGMNSVRQKTPWNRRVPWGFNCRRDIELRR